LRSDPDCLVRSLTKRLVPARARQTCEKRTMVYTQLSRSFYRLWTFIQPFVIISQV